MQRVADHGLKIDLHIHSKVSSPKDGTKVSKNTLENIPLLIQKLDEQGVNICAITDHDRFSYDMYASLKKAESGNNSIQKVLPGVEFSVEFSNGSAKSVIHIVTIFSDENDLKIRAVESFLAQNAPQNGQAYSEEEFLAILRKIELHTILIAHQKNSITSRKTRKNDANTLGCVVNRSVVSLWKPKREVSEDGERTTPTRHHRRSMGGD